MLLPFLAAEFRQVENLIKTYRKKEAKRHIKLKKNSYKKKVDKKYDSIGAENGVIKTQQNDADFVNGKIRDALSMIKKSDVSTNQNIIEDLKQEVNNSVTESSRKIVNTIKKDILPVSDVKIQESTSKNKKKDASMTSNNTNLKQVDVYIGSVRSINASLNEALNAKEKKEVTSIEAASGVLKCDEKNADFVVDSNSDISRSANKNNVLGSVTNLKEVSDNISGIKLTETITNADETEQVTSIEAKNSVLKSKQTNRDDIGDSKILHSVSACQKSNASMNPSVKNLNQVEDKTSGLMLTETILGHSQSVKEDKDIDSKSVEMTSKPEKTKGRIIDWLRSKRKSFSRVFAIFRPGKREIRSRSKYYLTYSFP